MNPQKFAFTIFAMLLISSAAIAQTVIQQPKIKKIIVTGSSEMDVEPDEVYVNFQLREYHNNKKEKVSMDAIRKEFLDACSKAGILKENISVEGMAGNAYGDWFIRKRKKDPDFIANITYIIKFSTSKMVDDLVGRLNDDAVSNMYISKKTHSKMEDFRKEVKIKATQAAKEKANYLAASIGEKISGALLIEEIDNSGGYVPMMMKASNMAMDAMEGETYGGETSMPFQKIKIRFETRAEFELQ